ncbi:uncharacterized protein LAESUDRAFT_564248 [Laetiporus sulphureus 93-53]|uniref:Uncharacterized protein n=1 Tax=Laetiporus sulphureus 93-53 TaxID=1314785 RepID=A0A165B4C4_9APHY|nr:uncharacterized protein LAESUDRAFT_564248 [Laetiporus sulphureus 93-53]KZT00204.1 hypothetical protein LAESUDRAFT_564248 [Laetiporus sulphureus 93-53]
MATRQQSDSASRIQTDNYRNKYLSAAEHANEPSCPPSLQPTIAQSPPPPQATSILISFPSQLDRVIPEQRTARLPAPAIPSAQHKQRRTFAHLDRREHEPAPITYVRNVHMCERQYMRVALDLRHA